MISIEQIFLLVVGCAINGTVDTLKDACTTSSMREIPYEAMNVDQQLPSFEEGHWYIFEMSDSQNARMEVLIKNGIVLQAGVEVVYPTSAGAVAENHFKEIASNATSRYGPGVPVDMGGVDNLNYGDRKSVFYIVKADMNEHPFIVFRAGNRVFWP